jgi:hypothetical protein
MAKEKENQSIIKTADNTREIIASSSGTVSPKTQEKEILKSLDLVI